VTNTHPDGQMFGWYWGCMTINGGGEGRCCITAVRPSVITHVR
jgi:hypothetical protein